MIKILQNKTLNNKTIPSLFGEPKMARKSREPNYANYIVTAVKGGGITFAGQVFSYCASLGFSVIIARFLGAGDYGLYKLSITVIGVVAGLSYIGLNGGITRFIPVALNEQNNTKVCGIVQVGVGIPAAIAMVLTLGVFLAADLIANQFFNNPDLGALLRLASLSIPLIVLTNCLCSIAQGFKQVQYEVYSRNFVFDTMKVLLSVLLLLIGLGVTGVVVAYVAAFALSLGLMLYSVYQLVPVNRFLKTAELPTRELLRYSFPLYLSRLLSQFGGKLEILVLGIWGVVADVGVFAIILSLGNIGNMGLLSLQRISAPIISELYSRSKYGELKNYYQTVSKWALTFNLPIFITMLIFSNNMLLIFGKEFTVGTAGLVILAAGFLFSSSAGISATLINMSGNTKFTFINSIVYLVATIFLDLILIPRWQLIGAACASAASLFIINIFRMGEVYILLNKLLPFNRSFLKPIAAAVLAGIITYWLRQFILIHQPIKQFVILFFVMWVVYVITILGLKLSDEDRLIINKIRNRIRFGKVDSNTKTP